MATDRRAKLGAGRPKRWGSLASTRPCVGAREHLCTSFIISSSNGNITCVSYKILNVQITDRGKFSPLPPTFPPQRCLLRPVSCASFLDAQSGWQAGPGPRQQETVSRPRGPPGTTNQKAAGSLWSLLILHQSRWMCVELSVLNWNGPRHRPVKSLAQGHTANKGLDSGTLWRHCPHEKTRRGELSDGPGGTQQGGRGART